MTTINSRQEFEVLQKKILDWAFDKGILASSDAKTQMLKCVSEVGELADAVAVRNRNETIDAIGDVLVTLIILAELENMDVVWCLEEAYEIIRARTGQMVEGVFVKD